MKYKFNQYLLAVILTIFAIGCATTQTLWDVHVLEQEEIIADATRRIERDPNDAVAYYDRGMAYLEIGASEIMEYHTGEADLENGKLNNAIADFSKAIELNPNYARAYEGRAVAYNFTNRPKDSITDLNKAEEIDPTIFAEHKNRGLGYLSETTKEFVFPVLDQGKRHREGNVILGSTTLDQVVDMLPAWPGHGPTRISEQSKVHEPGKIGEVIKKSRYSYNPMVAGNHIFVFDRDKRLIYIRVQIDSYGHLEENIDLLIQEKIADMMEKNDFIESSRDEMSISMRGEILPCVTAETIGWLHDYKSVIAIHYFFTCPITN